MTQQILFLALCCSFLAVQSLPLQENAFSAVDHFKTDHFNAFIVKAFSAAGHNITGLPKSNSNDDNIYSYYTFSVQQFPIHLSPVADLFFPVEGWKFGVDKEQCDFGALSKPIRSKKLV